ncbi:MAG: Cache 3/Cache 2 fusion domain-containing protein [Bacteroidales bacterium]|nr:Cache 3/Cache 2 fusion domain-containing protein [Bacteroidales bacterium]
MKIFNKIRILTQIQLSIYLVISVLFVSVGYVLYINSKQDIVEETYTKLSTEIEEFELLIDIYLKRNRDLLSSALKFADYKLNEFGEFEESDSANIKFDAVNPFTKEILPIKIHEWFIDDRSMKNNFYIVDGIKEISGVETSIYQKTDKGYVNISTSILNISDERMIGDIILTTSPIVESIENGLQYTGRLSQRNMWYLVSYRPIYIDGKIRGMYYVGIKERISQTLKSILENRNYFKSGYSFIVTDKGILTIHPTNQGMDYSKTKLFNILRKSVSKDGGVKVNRYKWPENEQSKWWYIQYKYIESIDSFICISYPEDELYQKLKYNMFLIFIWFLIFIFTLHIIITYGNNIWRKKLLIMKKSLKQMSEGKFIEKTEISGDEEFVELSANLNYITKRINKLSSFAKELAEGSLGQKYPENFAQDEIGNALMKIDDRLGEAKHTENIRRKEDEFRKWESEGLTKFVNILQKNTGDLPELCYDLISNLVEYLSANQGALFFINDDKTDDLFFEQMATYAYNKKKILEKKVYPNQGFIGRLFDEKETIILTDIPDDYIKITSGVGEDTPKNLIIVPLLLNMQVYGVIEIASFKAFKGYQIEFLEKIGENIASTINSLKINNKTKELLEQSRKQSDLLALHDEDMKMSLKETQNLQKESEAKGAEMSGILKAINSTLLVAEFSVDGKIIEINSLYLDLFGSVREDLIGKYHKDFSSMDGDSDEYKQFWTDLAEGKRKHLEELIKLPNSKEFWLSETYTPVINSDGEVYKVINTSINITKTKKFEIELKSQTNEILRKEILIRKKNKENEENTKSLNKKSEELEVLLDTIDFSLLRIEYELSGKLIYANKNYLDLTGYENNDIVGNHVNISLPNESLTEEKVYNEKITVKAKVGKLIQILRSKTPIYNEEGKLIKILVIAADVSDLMN